MKGFFGRVKSISYSWVILVVLFIGLAASFGMRVSVGLYIGPWEEEFEISRTMSSLVPLIGFVFFGLGQPVAGKLNDRFGRGIVLTFSIVLVGTSLLLTSFATAFWQIFILYGFGFSLGTAGVSNSIAAAILTKWFDKKRGLALGILMSGMAVGQLVMFPINAFLMRSSDWDWRRTLATLGVVVMVVVGLLFIFLLRSKPSEKGLKPFGYLESEGSEKKGGGASPEAQKTQSVFGVFKHKAFWLLAVPFFVCGFTDVGLINTHLPSLARERFATEIVMENDAEADAESDRITAILSATFMLAAAANVGGTILTGHMSDFLSRKKQLAFIYGSRACIFVLLILLRQPWLLLVFAVLYGAVEMASIAPTQSLAAQIFDKFSTGTVLGVISVAHQLGGAAGSWVPGFIYDLTNSYIPSLVLSIVLLLGVALVALRIPENAAKKA